VIQHEQLTLLTGITLHPVPVIITDGATIAAQPSPFRLSTFSNIPCVTWKREVSRSGDAAIKRVKVFLSQLTKFFSSGWRFTAFLPSRADFSASFRFSMTCSGAWATTQPRSSNPLRPARPPI
jgi:hypothetical protein